MEDQHMINKLKFAQRIPTGQNVIGKYKIIKKVGKGSYGDVYLVQDLQGLQYVVKAIERNLWDEKFENSYNQEVQILQKLDHKYIIKLVENFPNIYYSFQKIQKSVHAIVLEYAIMGDINKWIKKKIGGMREAAARNVFRMIVQAMDYMHDKNLAHRDIKVDNVCVDYDLDSNLYIKLIDFSLACDANQPSTLNCGTREYQAPELMDNKPYVPKYVDIYAMGILLFYILTKAYPCKFKAGKTDARYKYIYKKEFDEFWEAQEDEHGFAIERMSDQVKNLIVNLIAFDPKERPTTKEILQHTWLKKQDATIQQLEKDLIARTNSMENLKIKKSRDRQNSV